MPVTLPYPPRHFASLHVPELRCHCRVVLASIRAIDELTQDKANMDSAVFRLKNDKEALSLRGFIAPLNLRTLIQLRDSRWRSPTRGYRLRCR